MQQSRKVFAMYNMLKIRRALILKLFTQKEFDAQILVKMFNIDILVNNLPYLTYH